MTRPRQRPAAANSRALALRRSSTATIVVLLGVAAAGQAIVQKDVAALAERYDVPLRHANRADMAPDLAILREAGRGYDLVVLGVSRRPGDVLFSWNTAAAILERSPTSILFVAS